MCSAPTSSKGPATEEAAAPTGDKKYCSAARDIMPDLIAV